MKFGITQTFDCSYLPDKKEQLLVYADSTENQAWRYSQLIQLGFRRSGEQIYRPHCQECQACQSIRIPVAEFVPSKSQKRILNKNADYSIALSGDIEDNYYPLYERYINERHADGTMYPPSETQFESFVACEWNAPLYIEAYDNDKLIAVAVTDFTASEHKCLSALYTFFDPNYQHASLGKWMILQQILKAKTLGMEYLYLGYYVEGCQKMSYKRQFFPYEQFHDDKWQRFSKKPA